MKCPVILTLIPDWEDTMKIRVSCREEDKQSVEDFLSQRLPSYNNFFDGLIRHLEKGKTGPKDKNIRIYFSRNSWRDIESNVDTDIYLSVHNAFDKDQPTIQMKTNMFQMATALNTIRHPLCPAFRIRATVRLQFKETPIDMSFCRPDDASDESIASKTEHETKMDASESSESEDEEAAKDNSDDESSTTSSSSDSSSSSSSDSSASSSSDSSASSSSDSSSSALKQDKATNEAHEQEEKENKEDSASESGSEDEDDDAEEDNASVTMEEGPVLGDPANSAVGSEDDGSDAEGCASGDSSVDSSTRDASHASDAGGSSASEEEDGEDDESVQEYTAAKPSFHMSEIHRKVLSTLLNSQYNNGESLSFTEIARRVRKGPKTKGWLRIWNNFTQGEYIVVSSPEQELYELSKEGIKLALNFASDEDLATYKVPDIKEALLNEVRSKFPLYKHSEKYAPKILDFMLDPDYKPMTQHEMAQHFNMVPGTHLFFYGLRPLRELGVAIECSADEIAKWKAKRATQVEAAVEREKTNSKKRKAADSDGIANEKKGANEEKEGGKPLKLGGLLRVQALSGSGSQNEDSHVASNADDSSAASREDSSVASREDVGSEKPREDQQAYLIYVPTEYRDEFRRLKGK